jgi:cell division protein FtsW
MISGRRFQRSSADGIEAVRRHKPDYAIVIITSILLSLGLIVMYSISPSLAAQGGDVPEYYFVQRHFIAILLGAAAFFAASRIPLNFWKRIQMPMVVSALILCFLAYAIGSSEDYRWIQFGVFSFQPVELAKFVLMVIGASVLTRIVAFNELSDAKKLKPLFIVMVLFAFVIVVLQRDLGSAAVLAAMVVLMAYVAGLPLLRLFIFGGIIVGLGTLAIGSTPYRRERLLTFMQPERDCANQGYQACQAMIAVGSGGVFGVGLGKSVQAYGYLPEAENDSIFAIYAEKFGFIGVIALVTLYGALLFRILNIIPRAPNKETQLMAAGVFAWVGVQAFINMAAMVGLMPLKGIPLPLISYGGTSLIFIMAALGVVFQISAYTSMRKTSVQFDNNNTDRGLNENSRYGRRNSRPRYTITRRSI